MGKGRIRLSNLGDELRKIQLLPKYPADIAGLARLAGISESRVYDYLDDGPTSINISTLKQIAQNLGMEFLIEGDKVRFVPLPDNDTEDERHQKWVDSVMRLTEDSPPDELDLILEMIKRIRGAK